MTLPSIKIKLQKVSLLVADSQQVHTAMSVLLRLLPLLAVGCLLLQSLQPTAVSGQEVRSDLNALEVDDGLFVFKEHATMLRKKKKPCKKAVNTNEYLPGCMSLFTGKGCSKS